MFSGVAVSIDRRPSARNEAAVAFPEAQGKGHLLAIVFCLTKDQFKGGNKLICCYCHTIQLDNREPGGTLAKGRR
jgi:hypothetical protein